ncbi:MAG: DUF488 family protein, N3 subclade [Chloroflexota bacterium]
MTGFGYPLDYPYDRRTGLPRPLVPVRVAHPADPERFRNTFGLVDSGADGSLFHVAVALSLGLPIEPAAAVRTGGIAGDAGVVIVVERSRFAPLQLHADAFRSGSITPDQFVAAYRRQLEELRQRDPNLFLDLIAQARLGDVTLADQWAGERHSPKRVLADVLREIAAEEKRRRALHANASDTVPPPMAP